MTEEGKEKFRHIVNRMPDAKSAHGSARTRTTQCVDASVHALSLITVRPSS